MGTHPLAETLSASLPASALPMSSVANDSARYSPSPRAEILRHFDDVFSEAPATEFQDVQDAFRLRYQVYCLDRGFEEATACPSGMEQDRFDDLAYHSLLRDRSSARPIGTVRLVKPPATPTWFTDLPLAEYAPQGSIEDILRLPAGSTAEVSRFAITRSAREILRNPNKLSRQQHTVAEQLSTRREQFLPYMSLGLIRGLVRLSMQHGVTHWCLAAEPSLLRRLRTFGLHFQNAGALVEHRGLRQICYAELAKLLARAEAEQPEFWKIITEGGMLLSEDLARDAA